MLDDLTFSKILKYCDDGMWLKMKLTNKHMCKIGRKCERRLKERLNMEIRRNDILYDYGLLWKKNYYDSIQKYCNRIQISERQMKRKKYLNLFFIGFGGAFIFLKMRELNETTFNNIIPFNFKKVAPIFLTTIYSLWYYFHSITEYKEDCNIR